MKTFTCLCLLLAAGVLQARDLNIRSAWNLAEQHHPRAVEFNLSDSVYALKAENIETVWLPLLLLNARATWQSETAEIDVPLPGVDIPSPPQTNYSIGLQLRQTLYDGGRSSALGEINAAEAEVEDLKIAQAIYRIRADVNTWFFQCLSLQEDAAILDTQLALLNDKLREMRARLAQGVVTPDLIDQLTADALRLQTRRIGLRHQRRIALQRLSVYLGQNVDTNTRLSADLAADTLNKLRPEQRLFAAQTQRLREAETILAANLRPTVEVFGDAAFGRPGYNVFAEDPHLYALFGIQLNWKLRDWGRADRERGALQLQQEMVASQRLEFERERSLAMRDVLTGIAAVDEQMELDKNVVELRRNITTRSARRLDQGVVNAHDYLADIRALETAQLEFNRRRVERERLLATLHFLAGE